MPAGQPTPTELLIYDVKELGLPATGCLLAPWSVVLLVLHQLLLQRDRTARGVVELFSQGHCDAHPFVPKHRTEASLPPPPRGACGEAFNIHHDVNREGLTVQATQTRALSSQTAWFVVVVVVVVAVVAVVAVVVVVVQTICNAQVSVHLCAQVQLIKKGSTSVPASSAGLSSRYPLRLLPRRASSRRPQAQKITQPQVEGKDCEARPHHPALFRRKGDAIFSISSALSAQDPE